MRQERLIKLTAEERRNRTEAYFALIREDRHAQVEHANLCAEYKKARAIRLVEMSKLENELEIMGGGE